MKRYSLFLVLLLEYCFAAPEYPSNVLNLTNWKITLPTGAAESPTEISQPALATFKDSSYFYVNNTGNGVVFKAPCGGVTTSSSGYPRSELREMINNGKTNASWSTTTGTHIMYIRQAITHYPDVKKHVVAGQIHDAADDVIVIRLEDKKLFVDHNGNDGPTLTSSYQLGTIFTVKFVASGGVVKIYYNDAITPADNYAVLTSGCYFKAGCYTQSNTTNTNADAPSAYGEVVIYDLWVDTSDRSTTISKNYQPLTIQEKTTRAQAQQIFDSKGRSINQLNVPSFFTLYNSYQKKRLILNN